jgi:chromosome partitioning protein
VSDFVVIPVKPTPTDLRAVGVTVTLAKKHNKPFAFVITQAISRSTLTIKAPAILSNHGKVATMIMHCRSDYASCMGIGLTANEIDSKSKASEEIVELWQYLKTQIS